MMRIAFAFAVCIGVVHALDDFDTCGGDVTAITNTPGSRTATGDGTGPHTLAGAICPAGKGWRTDGTLTTAINSDDTIENDGGLLAAWQTICCIDCVAGETYSDAADAAQVCTACADNPTDGPCAAGAGKKCVVGTNSACVGCEAGTNYSLLEDNNACIACEPCGAGFKVATACIANTKTECEACATGFHRQTVDDGSTQTNCAQCDFGGACAAGKGIVCDPAGDGTTTCVACEDGYHSNVDTQTAVCTACAALGDNCPKGKGLVHCSKDGAGDDSACTACADGFFSDKEDKTSVCQAHNTCADEGGVKTPGTAEEDAVCSPAMKIATGLTSLLAVLLLLL